jgi:small subunit ribosomal protein S8
MTMTDPIADMLTRLRNASVATKDEVAMPSSTLKERIASILEREGYIKSFRVEGDQAKKTLVVDLKYGPARERTISGLRRVSKPGRRVYVAREDVPRVQGGLGVAIISTSQGLLTDRQAKKRRVGGEVLAYVW